MSNHKNESWSVVKEIKSAIGYTLLTFPVAFFLANFNKWDDFCVDPYAEIKSGASIWIFLPILIYVTRLLQWRLRNNKSE